MRAIADFLSYHIAVEAVGNILNLWTGGNKCLFYTRHDARARARTDRHEGDILRGQKKLIKIVIGAQVPFDSWGWSGPTDVSKKLKDRLRDPTV